MRFEKVSFEEYSKARLAMKQDLTEEELRTEYDGILLPRRQTRHSAGYDFYIPYDLCINSYNATLFPTGIRWIPYDLKDLCHDALFRPLDSALFCLPRSSLGFKYGTHLVNTVGVIDMDYHMADNEGHIMCKMMTNSVVQLRKGDRYMQGIILPFGLTDNDDPVSEERTGGIGSTGK